MAEEKKENKKIGRPKHNPVEEVVVDEKSQERLDMTRKEEYITIEAITKKWKETFADVAALNNTEGINTVADKWNTLNPFLQNQRLKNLYTHAKEYAKADIGEFLKDPANHERELRSLGWLNGASQQIYYNILRRACDIPLYNYYVIPELFDAASGYNDDNFKREDGLLQAWLETFSVANTFKTIALEIKREGKSSYLLRNKFEGEGKQKRPGFCTLQKLPTDWIKITGKGQLGFTISMNMMYFIDIGNNPAQFGEYMIKAWADLNDKGLVVNDPQTGKKHLDLDRARDYSFEFEGKTYGSSIEYVGGKGRRQSFMFWLKLPYDICYTFGSDNSQPWVAPDTMGLMLKLQELTDYGQLAGLIASTPLTAVLTGEIETIAQPRAGKNESVFDPEVLKGYMTQFNQATSTNVECWLMPATNIKLQQLSADVNSSEIISTATSNFLESAGEGGLTIATEKPNVAQITVAKQLAASQQEYVTLQFERVMNFIIQHKLGLKYHWKIKIWGDVFNIDNEKKFLKEIVANGNIGLFPKLMSAEGISMRDTKAITEYIKQFGFYKEFMTYTQYKNSELAQQQAEANAEEDEESSEGAGRPSIADGDVENDATAKSKENGTNTSDNREQNK